MRAPLTIAAVLLGCATVPAGPPPPPPEASFRGVKTVALAHRVEGGKGAEESRRRDPLDVLQEALAARGLGTVTVELPDRPPADLAAVEALVRQVEGSGQGTATAAGGGGSFTVGGRAAPVLAQLGCDVLAVYVRGEAWATLPPPVLFGEPYVPPSAAPASVLALVARDGTVVTFAWGGANDPYGDQAPANAAEAVDAALALLAPPAAE